MHHFKKILNGVDKRNLALCQTWEDKCTGPNNHIHAWCQKLQYHVREGFKKKATNLGFLPNLRGPEGVLGPNPLNRFLFYCLKLF